MNRYGELKKIFNEKKYFKVVCGAGNEDPDEVRKLVLIYTLAGANAMDVSANVEVVKNAVKGIDKAIEIAPKLKKEITSRPFINVSIGLKGDPHVQKAKIDPEKCVQCGTCVEGCPQKAISEDFKIKKYRCIGCGNCFEVCPADAVELYHKKIDFKKVLPECVENGAETLELHAIIQDDKAVFNDWKIINSILPNNFISMCMDRDYLSNDHLIKRIQKAKKITGNRLVIQADGVPMSGGSDNFNTTLQAIAIGDIIRKRGIKVIMTASGGTNSRTKELADLCGVKFDGVAIGTHARKIVSEYIDKEDFEDDIEAIKKAVEIAEELVRVSMD